ncbi:MAG: tetratricopeptide repeat protein, partial [Deltaproteobacteria bacterium]|nr:tetratricopeptide repeat protein [Deltaproteobacteria bacterium]
AAEPAALAPAYYLGRDLLDLGDAHLDPHGASTTSGTGTADADATTALLGRAVELCAEGDPIRARALLERCDPANADVAAALAACLVAEDRPAEAVEPLERARAAEPTWPLHHWNLAALHHRLGELVPCYHALRRFLATSEAPTALAGDPDQPSRLACATRMVADLERRARLTGTSLVLSSAASSAPTAARRPPARRKARPPAASPSRRRTARPIDE